MKYAKIKQDGSLDYAPKNKGSVSNWILKTNEVLAEGYLPVVDVNIGDDEYISGYETDGSRIFPKVSKIISVEEEVIESEVLDQKTLRINELRANLFETDYITCKLVEAIDEEEFNKLKEIYADAIAQRREWRSELDVLLQQ